MILSSDSINRICEHSIEKDSGNPNYRDVVNRIIESKEALNVAGELLINISQDEREWAIFRSRRI